MLERNYAKWLSYAIEIPFNFILTRVTSRRDVRNLTQFTQNIKYHNLMRGFLPPLIII